MPRISAPAERDPVAYTWELAGEIGEGGRGYSGAVYQYRHLPLREFEAARIRIAQINGCRRCLAFRTAPGGEGRVEEDIPEEFYLGVAEWDSHPILTDRERLAAEFAERFALRHDSLREDEEFWVALRVAFSDKELVELGLSVGSFLALGRFGRVFDIDAVCEVPEPSGIEGAFVVAET